MERHETLETRSTLLVPNVSLTTAKSEPHYGRFGDSRKITIWKALLPGEGRMIQVVVSPPNSSGAQPNPHFATR